MNERVGTDAVRRMLTDGDSTRLELDLGHDLLDSRAQEESWKILAGLANKRADDVLVRLENVEASLDAAHVIISKKNEEIAMRLPQTQAQQDLDILRFVLDKDAILGNWSASLKALYRTVIRLAARGGGDE